MQPLVQNKNAPRILIILHQENSTPGRVGQMLVERGFALDIRRPPLGHPLPDSLEHHAGAVMFGGPMSANDKEEFVKREIDWLAVPLREEKPFFGICLGAQKLVRHLGGNVEFHPDGCVEVGYYPLHTTKTGKAMMDWPQMVYQWHREGFDLPAGAECLAYGNVFQNQAFRYGKNAFGVQFHSELTLAMMHRWTVKGAHRMQSPGAQNKAQHMTQRPVYDPAIKQWLSDFLDIWIGDSETVIRRAA
ncbi:MAG: glutamine amidotransferase [Rhodobacteraceae bacterium]|nr:glutamine amidotransferase [Paracoccaceae bacterium]